MSILAGHHRYAHITSIRFDSVNPELLGMKKVISEDATRRALKALDEDAGIAWLDSQLHNSTQAALSFGSWILDTDTTVKCLYGKQEGAVVGYNPTKRGRPSHNYHSCFMGNTCLALTVEVNHGNQHTAKQVMPALWQYYDRLTDQHKPTLIRGDVFLGNEGFLVEAEKRSAHYLTKLRLTANVKKFITKLFNEADWVNAGHRFEGAESTLKLTGWSKSRRVVVLRRALSGDEAVSIKEGPCQLPLFFLETPGSDKQYEYAVLVTSLPVEMKNQWGWGGYTTQDLKRCRLVSRLVALVYNWWSLFVRLACPQKHFEAITSRPLLLHRVAKQTTHAGQTIITISSSHAKNLRAQSALQAISGFLAHFKSIGEQLHVGARMRLITCRHFTISSTERWQLPSYFQPLVAGKCRY